MLLKKIDFKKIIDFIVIVLLVILSIKKGGYYKSDSLFFTLLILIIGVIYTLINYFSNKKNNKTKFDIISLLLLGVAFCYTLPVVTKNYASLSSSIYEIAKFLNIYIIYKIVKGSDSKNLYINSIIVITLIQCIIGIDGIANRYLEPILNSIFNSGYLGVDITRMSATIQYANILAILCAVSIILLLNIGVNSKLKYALKYTAIFILLSSIILTSSRLVLILSIIAIIIYIIMSKSNRIDLINIFLSLVMLVIIYTSVMFRYIQIAPEYIYAMFAISIVSVFLIGFLINRLNYINFNYKKWYLIFGFVILLYIFIGLFLTKPLKLNINSQVTSRNMYNVNNQENNSLEVKINTLDEDTRYSINVYEVNKEFRVTHLDTFDYFENRSGNFKLEFIPKEDTKYISVQFKCIKGSFEVSNFSLNSKELVTDYYVLPSDIIFRLQDGIRGSSSVNDRVNYIKDAFKVITDNPGNFAFGIGGSGFDNTYERYQNYYYISSQVHNSFVQIFLESGIFSILIIISIIVLVIKRSKFDSYLLAFILFIIYSIFDLNFSFLLNMCIFAILLAITTPKETKKTNGNYINYIYIFENILFYIIASISIYYLINANIAYNVVIPTYDKVVNLDEQIGIVSLYEKKVNLDNSEYEYRKNLSKEYNTYIRLLDTSIKNATSEKTKKILQEELKLTVQKIEDNAVNMILNDKYNKYTILTVSDIYFKNLGYLVALNYPDNMEDGYKYYLTKSFECIVDIENNIMYNENAINAVSDKYKTYYEDLVKANEQINSEYIKEAIVVLKNKLLY